MLGLRCCVGFSLVAVSRCYSPVVCRLLTVMASLVAEHMGSAVVAPRRYSTGSRVVVHSLGCFAACEVFPDQGLKLCLLHWQAGALPLSHGKPQSEDILRDLQDNIQHTNILITEEREAAEKIKFKDIIPENFTKLGTETDTPRKHTSSNRISPKRTTPKHIAIKMAKIKDTEKIFKAAREKQLVTYQRTPIRLSTDLLAETLQPRR